MSKPDFSRDDKVQAMLSLIEDINAYPYSDDTKRRVLTKLDKYAISYLINELPENESYKYYTNKLDEYVVKLIKDLI